MLTEFHFDEELLSSDEITSEVSHALNISFLEFWFERGCFVYPYSNLVNYKEWIQYIHPKYIQKWQAAFTVNLTSDMLTGYKIINEHDEFSALKKSCLDNGIDLVLVSNGFGKFGINASVDFISNVIDIAKVSSFLSTPIVQRNKPLLNKGILPGENIEDVWRDQFLKVAKHSKKNNDNR